MPDWPELRLGDVVNLKRGYDLPHNKRRAGNVPIISSSGATGYHDEAKARGPGVVTGRYGTLGEVFFIRNDFWPLNTSLYVQDFKGNHPRFISYLLQTLGFAGQNVAGAVPGVNRNFLHMLKVQCPPPPTQEKIAAILSAYDDLIDNNTRRIAILEEMARSLYREWFVESRFPGHEGIEMVGAELGLVPTDWEPTTIDKVAKVIRGRSYRGADVVDEGGMPFLNLKCVGRDGGFRHDGIKFYVGPYKESQTARAGDIIMAVTDMTQERRIIARAARVPSNGTETWVMSMDLVRIAPFEAADSDYLYGMLRYSGFADEVKQHANGANVLHLNPERIEQFGFALPPEPLRRKYAPIASDIYATCDVLQSKNTVLRRTRDLLLPRLISGELDVSDLDIDIGELTE